MLTAEQIAAAAERLNEAERSRVQTGILSLEYPSIDMGSAYAVQDAWVKRKVADGRKVIGWKIGLTSKAMQYALNIGSGAKLVLIGGRFTPAGPFERAAGRSCHGRTSGA